MPHAASAPDLLLPDNHVIAVDGLSVRFQTSERTVDAVKNLSFHVARGETLAIVGESGSGKSVTSPPRRPHARSRPRRRRDDAQHPRR